MMTCKLTINRFKFNDNETWQITITHTEASEIEVDGDELDVDVEEIEVSNDNFERKTLCGGGCM